VPVLRIGSDGGGKGYRDTFFRHLNFSSKRINPGTRFVEEAERMGYKTLNTNRLVFEPVSKPDILKPLCFSLKTIAPI
jgi:hypothetical protein